MDGGYVQEQEHSALPRQFPQPMTGKSHLVRGRTGIGYAERGRPVTLGEEAGEHTAQGCLLIEEADAADAERVITPVMQSCDDVRGIEDTGRWRSGFAP